MRYTVKPLTEDILDQDTVLNTSLQLKDTAFGTKFIQKECIEPPERGQLLYKGQSF